MQLFYYIIIFNWSYRIFLLLQIRIGLIIRRKKMEIFIAGVAKIAEYTVEPIGRQVGYLYFYQRNLDELKTQIKILEYGRERLLHSVDDAKRRGEEIETDVDNWLKDVEDITEEVYDFLECEGQANKKCFRAIFPDLALYYRLSRKAKQMAQRVCDKGGQRFDPVSHIPLQQAIQKCGYEEFESRTQILNDIMEALRDPNFHIIGVWGIGGVGKTMLVKEVGKQAVGENLFSEMMFTCVSQNPNIEKIQQDIGEKLSIDLRGESVSERADQLRQRLRKEYKILLILDDVWHRLDLEEVGLSFGDDQKACKILLTSRSYNVLYYEMGSTVRNFQVGVIMEDEAMILFRKIMGAQVEIQNFKQLATQVVKHCGGLPFAITTVARALKNKSFQHWREALQQLRMSNPTNIEGMHQKVYSSIKLTYDFLESEKAKSLLLLCSLFETISIEQLSNYVIGLHLFVGIDKLEETRDKTTMLVRYLMDHCLLLDSRQGDGFAELHDVVRDVILSIASKTEQMYYITDAAKFDEYLDKKTFKGSTAISLYNINVDKYPETFQCPELKLLRLEQRNSDSLQIPDCFFKGLNTLYVLDLDGVHLEPLPSSLCLLQNLQTLHLVNCTLGDITSVGKLRNLQILNLSYSSIEELPSQIGQLRRLQYLNLQSCRHLKLIQPNVISSLIHLEELNLEQSFTNWEAEGVLDGDQRRNSNLGDVRNLPHLTNLRLNVLNVNILPKDMFSEKLKTYKIVIGTESPFYLVKKKSSRLLMLKLDTNSRLKEHDFEGLLKKSEDLHLIGLKSVKNVAYELDSSGFPELKHLRLEDSIEIQRIVNSIGNILSRPPALPSLETLHLKELKNMEKIIHGNFKAESFGKLRDIKVNNCGKLKSLFSLYIVRKLERIAVENCMMMEEIIGRGREGDVLDDNYESPKKITTCQLHSLRLENLPKLLMFCSKFITPENIEEELFDDSTTTLFNGEVTFINFQFKLTCFTYMHFWYWE